MGAHFHFPALTNSIGTHCKNHQTNTHDNVDDDDGHENFFQDDETDETMDDHDGITI